MSANGESDGTGCEPAGEVADGIAGAAPWPVACRIAALLAVDGAGLGGAVVAARHGPARARWLDLLVTNLPDGTPLVLTAPTIGDDRLLGGLEMAATLAARRPVLEAGAMARADGGLLLITGAERLPRATAARIAAALDQAGVAIHREGFTAWHPSRFGVVALDEGEPEAAACPASLSDRLAFHLTLDGIALADLTAADDIRALIVAARARLPAVVVPDEVLAALCEAAWRCAIASPRAALLAVRAARAVAALDGLDEVDAASAAEAARLVLAPRARACPVDQDGDEAPPEPADPPPPAPDRDPEPANDKPEPRSLSEADLRELLIEAVRAALPEDVLAQADTDRAAGAASQQSGEAGRAGLRRKSRNRGRQTGTRPGDPRGGARLDVLATLRASAPWQRMRRAASAAGDASSSPRAAAPGGDLPRDDAAILIRREDFRVRRFEETSATLTIFVVDASGSAALNRLGEAKGAVEILLARAYVRRDHVALISFRGSTSDLVLPPTRALARARRLLAGLPGGGGTPLAAALDSARAVAGDAHRRGQAPAIVLLTDCRTNVARDGSGGRPQAEADAIVSARALAAHGYPIVLIDTSPRPHSFAPGLTAALGARYLHLPLAASSDLAAAASSSFQR